MVIRLQSGSGDKTVRLWEVASGRELRRLTGHTDLVNSVVFSSGRPDAGKWKRRHDGATVGRGHRPETAEPDGAYHRGVFCSLQSGWAQRGKRSCGEHTGLGREDGAATAEPDRAFQWGVVHQAKCGRLARTVAHWRGATTGP